MFGETGIQNFAGAQSEQRADTTSQLEVATYIGSMASEMQVMASNSGLTLLAYLLSMVALHAKDMEQSGNPGQR